MRVRLNDESTAVVLEHMERKGTTNPTIAVQNIIKAYAKATKSRRGLDNESTERK